MKVHEFLCAYPYLPSRERLGKASKSELRRWCERGSVEINLERAAANHEMPRNLYSLVLHPKSQHRTTLYSEL